MSTFYVRDLILTKYYDWFNFLVHIVLFVRALLGFLQRRSPTLPLIYLFMCPIVNVQHWKCTVAWILSSAAGKHRQHGHAVPRRTKSASPT